MKRVTQRLTSGVLWGIVIGLSLIPLLYIVFRLYSLAAKSFIMDAQDQSFIDGTVGNWFATTIGLALGVPIGLWINNRQQAKQDAIEKAMKEQDAQEQEKRILQLIRDELGINKSSLEYLIEEQKTQPTIRTIIGMQDVVWKVLSDSGELKWVRDLQLLSILAFAYHYIQALILLESQYVRPDFEIQARRQDGTFTIAGAKAVDWVLLTREPALEVINDCIAKIDHALQSMS